MHSRLARDDETRMLKQRPHEPVMVVRAVDVDLDGRPIGASEAIWTAARVNFTFETGGDDA